MTPDLPWVVETTPDKKTWTIVARFRDQAVAAATASDAAANWWFGSGMGYQNVRYRKDVPRES